MNLKTIAFGAGLLLATQVAFAIPYLEVGDAPDGVPGHQTTVGIASLTNIIGSTNGVSGDFRDTYSITITDVNAFYATTSPNYGNNTGTATFDTRLWLWDMTGNILLGNDDSPGGAPFHSYISDPSTYAGATGNVVNSTANGIQLQANQMYLLSISGFNDSPNDAGGVNLALLGTDFDALHGPNPQAGAFSSWAPGGATGNYNIELGGATFYTQSQVPAPGTLMLLGLGICGMLFARKKRG